MQGNPITENIILCLDNFCPNELIILVSTGCSCVKTTSYYLNINLILNLWADVLLKSIITLIANFFYKKYIALVFSLFSCFFLFSCFSGF